MFCPECKSMMKVRKRGKKNVPYCPRCSDLVELSPEEIFEPVLDPGLGAHPDIAFFPYPKVRIGQDEFIKDVAKSIAQKKHLLAYAPTGIGKTVAALAPAVEASIKMGKVVCFLTSKQSQHHIAVETLRQMKTTSGEKIKVVDLISKQAMCPAEIAEEYPAAFRMLCFTSQVTKSCHYFTNEDKSIVNFVHNNIMHVEELKTLATRRKVCPHKVALQAAAEANVIVCDYNHIFDPVVRPNLEEAFGRPIEDFIVIVDEAHNLPDRIRGYYSMSLTTNMVEEALHEVNDKHLASILKGMKKDLSALLERVDEGKEVLTEAAPLLEALNKRMDHSIIDQFDLETMMEKLRDTGMRRMADGRQSVAFDVYEFLAGYKQELKGLLRIISRKDGMMLNYRLLDPSVVATPVFDGFHSSIVMSGTLYPTLVYADILGIPVKKRMLKSYRSPFPEENRPVFVSEEVTTLYNQRSDAMYKKIASNISGACDLIPGNVAVFFQSYGMLKNIMQHIQVSKETIFESRDSTKAEKRGLITKLVRLKNMNGGIMLAVMGGSLSEGIDYKDNLLDAVIVVGVPFAPPSLEQDQLIYYYDMKFGPGKGRDYGYNYPAMNRVLQSIGRCIRSETDRAAVILLDKRFGYPNYKRYFPEDVKLRTGMNLKSSLRKFYGN
ncbi:MAG: helicase C-terminal domain-containing protein [Thermoplasmata archaeon]|nr:helicase C-terminal domain-containing protein [Thermoplasmata archaeon]